MQYETFLNRREGFINLQSLRGTRFADDAVGLQDAVTIFCDLQGVYNGNINMCSEMHHNAPKINNKCDIPLLGGFKSLSSFS